MLKMLNVKRFMTIASTINYNIINIIIEKQRLGFALASWINIGYKI